MKTFLLSIALFFVALANAQTAIIAHKSHSGKAESFFHSFGNFGVPSPRKAEVIYVNDSTVIQRYVRYNAPNKPINGDTVFHHPVYSNPAISTDSLKKREPGVEFKNFPKKVKSKSIVPTSDSIQEKNTFEIGPNNSTKTPEKKSNSLPFIFIGCAFVFFIALRLFSRKKVGFTSSAFGIFMCLSYSASYGQTAIIAHKSHSGAASSFFIDPSTNFGEPSPRIIEIQRLNDSITLVKYDQWGDFRVDTIKNDPLFSNPSVTKDSIKEIYNPYIEIKGFDTVKINGRVENAQPVKVQEFKTNNDRKSRKKRGGFSLMYLFLGLGLIGSLRFFKSKTPSFLKK